MLELKRFESWVPTSMLELRTAAAERTACTLFVPCYMGRSKYEPNQLFVDTFGDEHIHLGLQAAQFGGFTLDDLRDFHHWKADRQQGQAATWTD